MDYQKFLDENPTWDEGSNTLWERCINQREISHSQFNIAMLLLSHREGSREEGRELVVTPGLINGLVESLIHVRLGNYTGSDCSDIIEAREDLPTREETIESIIDALEELV